MNKTAIKNFAIWARNKLIADISYKAGLLGITEKGIKSPLPQSTHTVQFFDIGTKEPSSVTGVEIQQRKKLVEEIERKAKQSDYATAYKNVIEEVAYTWFNRLIAIRFMEVNNYLPTRIRVLSSESNGKSEPDLVTHALEANLDYSAYEKDRIIQLKNENKLDELFRMLFIKQCNALNANLPELFEKTSNYTELLLNISFTDREGIVYHLVNDISEDDFNVSKEGQVEIIGWLYQYYNTEPKDETFALLKKNVKITKERIPAATQLFTPDWIVRYMVENSLGRLWLEGHPNDELKSNWHYFLDEVEQEEDVQKQLEKIREEYKSIKPEDIKIIDPAMGSGHILVYAFDVLMQIYESYGFSQRDAAKSIIENNLYGLDIDNRAYQLAYFAVMMKARQYNRRILNGEIKCNVYAIQESNNIKRDHLEHFGTGLSNIEKKHAALQLQKLIDAFTDAKEYGSILNIENLNWELLRDYISCIDEIGQVSLDTVGLDNTKSQLYLLSIIGEIMAQHYDVVITNPPYMGSRKGMNAKLKKYVEKNYPDSKSDLYACFIEKSIDYSKAKKYISMITQQSFMFTDDYKELRVKLTDSNYFINMAHLGSDAFPDINGEVVQTTSFVIGTKQVLKNYKGKFARLVDYKCDMKSSELTNNNNWFLSKSSDFSNVKASPFSYWLTDNMRNCFTIGYPFEKYGNPKAGITTGQNDRFLRTWFEVERNKIGIGFKSVESFHESKKLYIPYNKGGRQIKWYGNNDFVLMFDKLNYDILSNQGNHLPSRQYYCKKCITWSDISGRSFAARYCDYGFIFDVKGSCGFPFENHFWHSLALLNSKLTPKFIDSLNPTTTTQVGDLKRIPVIEPNSREKQIIESLSKECVSISKNIYDSYETSWDFSKNPLISGFNTISDSYREWSQQSNSKFIQLKKNEEELNKLFIDLYGLQKEIDSDVCGSDITIRVPNLEHDIRCFISYSVGCMLGRYSLDREGLIFAGGKWDISNYMTYKPDEDNIIPITDEEYFEDDIVGRFIEFLKVTYGLETLETNLDFIAEALGNKGASSREVIREYFVKEFYNDHCRIYSVTGAGKRPIYWLFDSGKQNGFKALVYMHRYDENTIGNLRIDYLHRMQRIYENEIARMQEAIENSKDAREVTAATKRKEKLIKQLQETKEYDEKIAHLALARTSIDLDDGVKVNYEKVQTDRDGKKLDVLAKI